MDEGVLGEDRAASVVVNVATVQFVPESEETLDEFAASLSYGSRSDLSFKFLSRFDGAQVGDAIASLLGEIGALWDSGDPGPLIDLAIELQATGYGSRPVADRYQYDDGPFTAPSRPVAESRVALLTSSGHFAPGDDPQPLGVADMTQDEAEQRIGDFLREQPTLSAVPVDEVAPKVRHGGYDVRGARVDHNVAFPIDRMRELDAAGVIGTLVPEAFSFVGACAQTRLLKQSAPAWADRLGAVADVVLLVPV